MADLRLSLLRKFFLAVRSRLQEARTQYELRQLFDPEDIQSPEGGFTDKDLAGRKTLAELGIIPAPTPTKS